jgi:hypothetical protein
MVMLRESLPDSIVSDLKMPAMSGFEFLSIVRRRFSQLSVIAISEEYDGLRPVSRTCSTITVPADVFDGSRLDDLVEFCGVVYGYSIRGLSRVVCVLPLSRSK